MRSSDNRSSDTPRSIDDQCAGTVEEAAEVALVADQIERSASLSAEFYSPENLAAARTMIGAAGIQMPQDAEAQDLLTRRAAVLVEVLRLSADLFATKDGRLSDVRDALPAL